MADEGDAASLTILGLRNKPRRGFSGNPVQAYRQFRLAADHQGDVQAQYWVGMMEGQGVGTERNLERAVCWIATAAEQGQSLSISLLGIMRIQRLGLPENSDEGVRLIREAAEMGMPKARYRLGYMYLKGEHLAMDTQQACIWFFLAYEGTNLARPYLKILREEMDPADYDRALAEAAKLDDTFTDPELPAPDPDEPPPNRRSSKSPPNPTWRNRRRCLPTPRKLRHPLQAVSHKILFLSLMLSAMACAKKEKSLEQLADEGDSVAQYEMGRQFYVGDHGRPRDLLIAFQWFVRAAEAGDTGAQNTLGVMLQNGEGVGADLDRAREWYQRAADAGRPKAQSNLGHLYAMGIGVEKNIVQARQWFALTAAAGDQQGQSNLAVVKRFITAEELAAAQARVREWNAQHQ